CQRRSRLSLDVHNDWRNGPPSSGRTPHLWCKHLKSGWNLRRHAPFSFPANLLGDVVSVTPLLMTFDLLTG
ncbi:MAG: hypothetical protein KDA58_17100, partial [Planctomycetaceae bacterium]|nr:hypothetical protein [Planctomycetaceae bacterium]